jgi:hypothetical protein
MRDQIAYELKAVGTKKPLVEGKADQDFYKKTGRWRGRAWGI